MRSAAVCAAALLASGCMNENLTTVSAPAVPAQESIAAAPERLASVPGSMTDDLANHPDYTGAGGPDTPSMSGLVHGLDALWLDDEEGAHTAFSGEAPEYGPPGSDSRFKSTEVAAVASSRPGSAVSWLTGPTGTGLSDEQDFDAVAARESIESDALRRQRQQMRLLVFKPTELPERQGNANVAEFAFSVSHNVGTRVYPRSKGLFKRVDVAANCKSYPDADAAQISFLDAGGPERDELGLDPDGDGFACGWSPAVYRRLF